MKTKYPDTSCVLNRCDIVDKSVDMETRITNNEPLLVMPIDVTQSRRFDPYTINIFGTLEDGSKAEVIISDLLIYFDVKVPDKEIPTAFMDSLNLLLQEKRINVVMVLHYAKPFMEFQPDKSAYIRLSFSSLNKREEAINFVNSLSLPGGPITISSDDTPYAYYRKFCRERQLPLCDWLRIEKYEYSPHTLYQHQFTISRDSISHANTQVRSKSILLTWDIETYSPNERVPMGFYKEDHIIMICCTVHYIHDPNPLQQICICITDVPDSDEWCTVVCASEEEVIKAFIMCVHYICPDIITGFNDFSYDWPFLIEKIKQYELEPFYYAMVHPHIYEYNSYSQTSFVTTMQAKIGAGNIQNCILVRMPGIVPIDTRLCFMKLYPRADVMSKSSLNFYLHVVGLESKVELSVNEMWAIYRSAMSRYEERMSLVARYCVVDALRCVQLLHARHVISESSELANLTYISLWDAIMYAGGMKVTNLVCAYAHKMGYMVSMRKKHSKGMGKEYPGAYVFPPVKGVVPDPLVIREIDTLRTKAINKVEDITKELVPVLDKLHGNRPIVPIDFSSLYPSLIETYNYSHDAFIATEEKMIEYKSLGYKINNIHFEHEGKHFNGWTVAHGNDMSKLGVLPRMLMEVLESRQKIRKEYESLCTQLVTNPNDEHLKFLRDCANTKQLARKVLANTTYGELGNAVSILFNNVLAGAVTSSGRRNLMLIHDYLKGKGINSKYGDTDSLFIYLANTEFMTSDLLYIHGQITKTEWYIRMVEHTRTVVKSNIVPEVNAFLEKDNGSKFLKVSDEEIMFPYCFFGKKQYVGIKHYYEPNFSTEKIYIKGGDLVKCGISPLSKKTGMSVLRIAMDINNEMPLPKIVENTVKEFLSNPDRDVHDYEKTAKWKGDLKIDGKGTSPQFIKFIERMRYLGQPVPDTGDRFSYVIVKPKESYTYSGYVVKYSVADCMEYPSAVEDGTYELDLMYYLRNIIGLLARFINLYFQDTSQTDANDTTYEVTDKQAQVKAVKHLTDYAKTVTPLNSVTIDKKLINKMLKEVKEYVHANYPLPVYRLLYEYKFKRFRNPNTLLDRKCINADIEYAVKQFQTFRKTKDNMQISFNPEQIELIRSSINDIKNQLNLADKQYREEYEALVKKFNSTIIAIYIYEEMLQVYIHTKRFPVISDQDVTTFTNTMNAIDRVISIMERKVILSSMIKL